MIKASNKAPVKKNLWVKRKHLNILIWMLQIVGTLLFSAFVAYMYFSGIVVQENSMSPTIQAKDQVHINRMTYILGTPDRGDVIAFRKNSDLDNSTQIKRVIGIPGDTIQIMDGVIVLNGKTYIEDKTFSKISHPGAADEPIKLGPDEYFVLGDNRNNSEDSRFPDIGNVNEEQIFGKVWLVTTPFERFGFVD